MHNAPNYQGQYKIKVAQIKILDYSICFKAFVYIDRSVFEIYIKKMFYARVRNLNEFYVTIL